jgi:hypothetical protein
VRIQIALTGGTKMKTPTTEAIAIMSVIKKEPFHKPEKDD